MAKTFFFGNRKIRRSNAFVDASLHLSQKVNLGKIGNEKVFGFICLKCWRLRTGIEQKGGALKCTTCGYVAVF